MSIKSKILFSLLLISISTVSLAAGKGQGGIVIKDKAQIYAGSTGDSISGVANEGDAVSGVTTSFLLPTNSLFEKSDGRVHVMYLIPDSDGNSSHHFGWMNPSDLSNFYFECGCSGNEDEDKVCSPYTSGSFGKVKLNPCFAEAQENKLETLKLKK